MCIRDRYSLLGPESDVYDEAPRGISMTYFSGSQAIAQEAEIEDDTTLSDLVDLSEHNDDLIDDAIEDSLEDNSPEAGGPTDGSGDASEDDADSGLLPFISPVLTISMIATAGIFASRRNRDE
mgnify:CR=1 FL=1